MANIQPTFVLLSDIFSSLSAIEDIKLLSEKTYFFADLGVVGGFPSPAQDLSYSSIDLNKELIPHPASTFFAKVRGKSMCDCGIDDGDLIIVDKSLEAQNHQIAVCFYNGSFTVKRLRMQNRKIVALEAENPDFAPIEIREGDELLVWGIVTHVIKSF